MQTVITRFEGPWTYSRLEDFETCKLKFKLKHIDKLQEEKPSPALERGAQIHEMIEAFLNGWIKELKDIKLVQQITSLKKLKPLTEKLWAHDHAYLPMPDPFDKKAWCRAKLDAFLAKQLEVRVIDFKTGRIYPQNQDQVRFYGMLGLMRAPLKSISKAVLELWYVDQDKIVPCEPVTRADVPKIAAEFDRRAKVMYAATKFPAEPGLHCRTCPYRKNNGGPCPI